ncbi:hypothetical protein CVT25_012118 [Psilocybe cyanescens]|uniref:Uncharacterized protein n=1 Tax=Psilocybe cyanescens TaxID=93625 RepID=A0A409XJ89_PSICY|nr:hypothetical protein CVT25_012118 [Psilocybe cyanescens]
MHSSRRNTGLTPLAIVLPHPQLIHRRSSLLSINSAASPHTPRSCSSPSLPIYYQPPANRNSTDSWNSSNADDMDVEWKQEHVLLLSRTLDALPAHLVTPFNGSIPPSNLLDKIARGVSQAKGPAEWPYSIRATRVKLLELARSHAKEEAAAERRRHAIAEEVEINDESNYSYFHNGEEKPLTGVGIGPRRPLYRQSSMDFIKPTPSEIKDNPAIAKLSNRLQRTDRIIPNPSYHPYSRISRSQTNRRSSSPPHSNDVPALINQSSTPSSTTLDSFSTLSSSTPRVLRRSVSTLSSESLFSTSSSGMPLPDPRIQRVRRSDSFCSGPPVPPPKDTPVPPRAGFKRAPSYGALAQEARQEAVAAARVHARKLSGSYPSSDEEEKARTTRAKKPKTKTSAAVAAVPASPSVRSPPSSVPPSPAGPATAPSSPVASRTPTGSSKPKSSVPKLRLKGVTAWAKGEGEVESNLKSPKALGTSKPSSSANKADETASKRKTSKTDKEKVKDKAAKDKDHHPRVRPLPMNLQRNPSMFGAELPQLPLRATQNNSGSRIGASSASSPPSAYMQRSGGSSGGMTTPTKMRSPSPAIHALAPAASVNALAPAPVLGPALDGPSAGAHCAYNSHVTSTLMSSPTLSSSPSLALSMSPEISVKVRTLRRVRRLAPGGRRISFGSLAAPGEEGDADAEGGGLDAGARSPASGKGLLGSAFQLH